MEIINVTDEIIEINVTEAVVNIVTQTGAYPLPSNVFSVFGRVGNVVGQAGDYTTSIVAEGTNLYYTDARSRAAISENITGLEYSSASGIFSLASGYLIPTQAMLDAKQDDLNGTGIVKSTSGTISYLTDNTANWDAAYNDKINSASVSGTTTKVLTLNQQDGGTITASWTDDNTDAVTSVFGRTGAVIAANGDYTTSQVTEGTNLYFTNARVHDAISANAPLSEVSGVVSISQAGASTNGFLSSTDWNTFNGKENFLASGTTAQYYRGDKTFQTLDTLAVPENTNLYYTQARFDTAFGNKSTTNLTEGTNLYYTDARARAAITGTAPIDVSGGVVSISQASGASNGYLSSTDWTTFNNKQAALNGTGFVKISGTTISYDNNTYLTTISGIAAGGELSGTYANPSLVNSAVTGKVLTGLNLTGGGTIADTDSILGAFGKVQNQISALVGGVMYEGTWNASTNTPTIVSSVGSKGDYYIVSTAGSTNINGITSWNIGDWIIFNGSTWDKVDNTDAVSSVNGYTGAVSLVTSDVPESGSLYFTNARAIGSTLTGYTSGSGVVAATDTILQAIQKLNGNVSGLVTGVSSVFGRTGAVIAASGDYNTSQVTENTNLYYTEARVSANTDVAANTAARHAAVTIGTANGLSLSTQALSLAAASTSTTGALTSTDWNTFNNKLSTATAASTYVPYTGATGNVTLGTNSLTAGVGSFASSGGSDTFTINHSSGSGIALNITKGGNGEGLYINKTSGSGNAATIIGTLNATTLVKNGGTSSQFLKADGSVDSSTYLTTSAASSTYLPLAGGTLTGALSGTSATFSSSVSVGTATNTPGSAFNSIFNVNGANLGGTTGNTAKIANLGFDAGGNHAGLGITAYRQSTGTNFTTAGIKFTFDVDNSTALYDNMLCFFGGNIGIGTNNPSQILDVQTAAAIIKLKSTTGTNSVYTNYENSAGNFYVGRDSSTGNVFGGSAYAAVLYAGGSYPMEFWTGTSRKMVISSGGNVNIGGNGTIFPVLTIQGIASSPHIGSSWSVSANQDGNGRTIIGTAGQGRAMYFENNGDIVIPNNPLSVTGRVNAGDYTYSSGGAVLQSTGSVGTTSQYGLMFNNGGVFYWGKDDASGGSFGMGGYANILYGTGNTPMVFVTASQRRLTIEAGGSVIVAGALSKGSGSFRIPHPLESKNSTHDLVHSFVESPQANNIYRGKIQLVNGKAVVNLDEVSTMTKGTFVALNREIHTYTSNETDWDAVRGKVEGNILTIECQNIQSNAIVSWLVIGERQDKHMYDTDWTDENGKVIVEPLRRIEDTKVTSQETLCHINANAAK
jgi:hypothetical protein